MSGTPSGWAVNAVGSIKVSFLQTLCLSSAQPRYSRVNRCCWTKSASAKIGCFFSSQKKKNQVLQVVWQRVCSLLCKSNLPTFHSCSRKHKAVCKNTPVFLQAVILIFWIWNVMKLFIPLKKKCALSHCFEVVLWIFCAQREEMRAVNKWRWWWRCMWTCLLKLSFNWVTGCWQCIITPACVHDDATCEEIV